MCGTSPVLQKKIFDASAETSLEKLAGVFRDLIANCAAVTPGAISRRRVG